MKGSLLYSAWVVLGLTISMPALGQEVEELSRRQALRRSPVVQVFERTKNAVVNISTTQIIQVRSSLIFDSLFDEMFDFPTGRTEPGN